MTRKGIVVFIAIFTISLFIVGVKAVAQSPIIGRSASNWYVSPAGEDSNDCLNFASPCASINGALNKAGFVDGDIIRVATGVYSTTTGSEVVLLNKSGTISGGWDTAFESQVDRSTIDGSGARRGITIPAGVTAVVDRVVVQNGQVVYNAGAGIYNLGNLTLTNSIVQNNTAGTDENPANSSGAGIYNAGFLDLEKCSVNNNSTKDHYADYGGGIMNDAATLIINQSSINNNHAGNYGGGIANFNVGTLIVNNSTISGNFAGASNLGGGIHNGWPSGGPAHINNSTIANNIGVGITSYDTNITLQNTILAGNINSDGGSGDCVGTVNSSGFNILGNSVYCTFISTTGDLVDVNPGIHPLLGLPAYHPITFVSPAVNAGDPDGCTDYLGQPLPVDQRGVARYGRCDIGAYEYDPAYNAFRFCLLPFANRQCPPLYADDFSDPASGWPIIPSGRVIYQYNNGEYRINIKSGEWLVALARPGFKAANYKVSVDLRNVTGGAGSYGIAFGIKGDWSGFYSLQIYPDTQYVIYRYNSYGIDTLAWGYSSAIHPGTQMNHISLERDGVSIKAYANGAQLTSVSDGTLTGVLYVGLLSSVPNDLSTDIRYDNFKVFSLSCIGTESLELPGTDLQASWFEAHPEIYTLNSYLPQSEP